jgi:Domain of unknown function (DUF4153)
MEEPVKKQLSNDDFIEENSFNFYSTYIMMTRIQDFLQDWIGSLTRYPIAHIISIIMTIIRIVVIHYEAADYKFLEILATCGLVFPLVVVWPLALQITDKRHVAWMRISQIIGFMLWIGFYIYIHSIDIFGGYRIYTSSYEIFFILSYIIARWSIFGSVLYSTYKEPLQTRWWVKELLSNILIALVSALILRWGISASIWSVDYLFNINISYKRYQYIGVIAFCLVGISILLTNLITIKKVDDYSKTFRFFGLYIFLPLAVIYAAILITYGAKILITQTWPKGLISWMVIWYTIRCTIVYFLTYPLQTLASIKKTHTWYFISILVFLPFLIWAIWQRISQYGITESRYLIIMVALWITIVGVGSLIWRSKSWILMIGWFLFLTINSAYLPWSATSLSFMSQTSRLEYMLKLQWFFGSWYIIPKFIKVDSLTGENYDIINSIKNTVIYISKYHGTNSLAYLYSWTWFDYIKNENYRTIDKFFLESLWYTGNFDQYESSSLSSSVFFSIDTNQKEKSLVANIKDYTTLLYISSQQNSRQDIWWVTLELTGKDKENILIKRSNKSSISINLYDYKDQILYLSSWHDTLANIPFDWWRIIVDNLNGTLYKKDDSISIWYYSLIVLIK